MVKEIGRGWQSAMARLIGRQPNSRTRATSGRSRAATTDGAAAERFEREAPGRSTLAAAGARLLQGLVRPAKQVEIRDPKPAVSALFERVATAACNESGGTVASSAVVSHRNELISVDVGGDAIFEQMACSIRDARHEILLQTFAWEAKSNGAKAIAAALRDLAAARRAWGTAGPPLPVHVVINEMRGPAQMLFRRVLRTKYWPTNPQSLGLTPPEDDLGDVLDIQVATHRQYGFGTLHAKTLVVDGHDCVITGANVQQRNHGDQPAYDMSVRVRGDVGVALRQDFDHTWQRAHTDGKLNRPLPEFSGTRPQVSGSLPIAAITREATALPIASNRHVTPQNAGLLTAIANAQHHVAVQTPNLNADEFINALAAATRRGVRVELLLSRGFNASRLDNPVSGLGNDAAIARLRARCGPHADLLDVRWYVRPDGHVANDKDAGGSHVKLMCVDHDLAIVGNANLDKQSILQSHEVNLALGDAAAARKVENEVFRPAFARAVPVD